MRALLPLLLFLITTVASAGQPLGPRPDINDYQDRDAFIRDVLAWEKRRASQPQAPGDAEDAGNTNKQGHDWHHVTGPEDLETALRNAEGYVQPDYKQTYRFNRTTHLSFPLSKLEREQLAEKRVEVTIPEGMAAIPPEEYLLEPGKPFLPEESLVGDGLQNTLATPRIKQGPAIQSRLD